MTVSPGRPCWTGPNSDWPRRTARPAPCTATRGYNSDGVGAAGTVRWDSSGPGGPDQQIRSSRRVLESVGLRPATAVYRSHDDGSGEGVGGGNTRILIDRAQRDGFTRNAGCIPIGVTDRRIRTRREKKVFRREMRRQERMLQKCNARERHPQTGGALRRPRPQTPSMFLLPSGLFCREWNERSEWRRAAILNDDSLAKRFCLTSGEHSDKLTFEPEGRISCRRGVESGDVWSETGPF
jgi:hypothetical protein